MKKNIDKTKIPTNWDAVELDVIKFMISQGDSLIKAQMQLALDADKRALAYGASATTFSTAIFATVLVAYNKDVEVIYLAPGIVASITAFCAACVFFFSARPMSIIAPGNEPANWWENALASQKRLLGSETINYQETINKNSSFLEDNSIYVKVGMAVFAANPLLALICFLILLPS